MARIAALLPHFADRHSLDVATRPTEVAWANSWRELYGLVRSVAITAAIADLHAETRRDGVLRVLRFAQRYPLTPLVVWGDLDGRELFRLGKAGAADVVVSCHGANHALVGEIVTSAMSHGLSALIIERLRGRVSEEAHELVRTAVDRTPDAIQVPTLAALHGISISTLERRCLRWGLPTPGRLLLWLRVLCGLRWLLEPGRSVESVAMQLGYSSGAAFRRAIKATVGSRPTPLRTERAFNRAVDAFIAECPGDTAYRRLSATD